MSKVVRPNSGRAFLLYLPKLPLHLACALIQELFNAFPGSYDMLRLLAVLTTTVVFASCAGIDKAIQQQQASAVAETDAIRKRVKADMAKVARAIKPEHFATCRKRLAEKWHLLGAKYEAVSTFKPSVKLSCAAGDRWMPEGTAVAAYAFLAANKKSAGKKKRYSSVRACRFTLRPDGTMDVRLSTTEGPRNHVCHSM